MNECKWKGLFPAVATQMRRDESLDLQATASNIQVLLDSGVSGIIMLGSLGENNCLTATEKLQVVETAVKAVNGRVPVLSCVSELSTRFAMEYVGKAEKLGLDGFMVLPAMAYHSDSAETINHYKKVAGGTGLPIMIYNNPVAYKVDITPAMLDEMSDTANFVAIKESSADVRRITDIFNKVGNRYAIFAGVDDLALECALLGAVGWVVGVGLAFPKENARLWDLAMAGKWEEARELYRWFMPLLHLDVGPKFVQNIKLAIQEVGLGKEWVRQPRLPLSGDERKSVLSIIHEGIDNRPQCV